jgi:hypothetical protein
MSRRMLPLLVAFVLCFVSTARSQTNFRYVSEPFDFVGGGQSMILQEGAPYVFQATSAPNSAVRIIVRSPDFTTFWTLTFAAPGGGAPGPGTYLFAHRFATADRPGLDVGGNGNGCNQTSGRFVVSELSIGAGNVVERFAADFEQHCENLDPALIGSIRINSSAPTLLARFQNAANQPASFSWIAEPGALLSGTSGTYTQATGPFNLFSGGQGGVRLWLNHMPIYFDMSFESGLNTPLTVGDYPNAQSIYSNPFGVPGFDLSAGSTACSTAGGNFNVSQVEYFPDTTVKRLALDFEFHCNMSTAALFGVIRINSTVPSTLAETAGMAFSTAFCFGDSCPCGNLDSMGGCAHALGNGAALTVSAGGPSLAVDDLQILAAGMPPHRTALLLASARTAAPVAFGNGQMCLGGPIRRLGIASADDMGNAVWNDIAPRVAGLANWLGPIPGSPVRFQAWYRDASALCGSGTNLTSALQVSFTP